MTPGRKKLYIGLFVTVLGLFGIEQIWSRAIAGPRADARRTHEAIKKRLKEAKLNIRTARKDLRRLDQWRKRSLPTDIQGAQTLYQGWLHDLLDQVELEQRFVDSGAPVSRQGHQVLPFTVRGAGTMEQFTKMLFEFYRAPHLHRIRSMSITPIAAGERLDLSFAIDALIVDGCERTDRLADGEADVLASSELRDYRALVDHNLFGRSPRAEVVEQTELTAIVAVNGIAQAWFLNRMDDSMAQLGVGDRLRAGWFEGQVVEIEGDDVVLVADGERWLLTRGDRLADAFALPPEF